MARKLLILLVVACLQPVLPANAQTVTPSPGPVYIVQAGDTLWDIAIRFNASVDELLAVNALGSDQQIYPGDRLIIPGLEGLSGILLTQPVPFGEHLRSLSRQYQVDPALLVKLNHIVSPAELYAGYPLVMIQAEDAVALSARSSLITGETLLEMAVRQNSDPWTIAKLNGLASPSAALPGENYYLPSGDSTSPPTGLPDVVASAVIAPLPVTQGTTLQVEVTTNRTADLTGQFVGAELRFFQQANGAWIALQGIHAMLDPGLYPMHFDFTLPGDVTRSFEQMVLVAPGDFINEAITGVDASTLDPAVTEPENEWLLSLVSIVTLQKYWQSPFLLPVAEPYCLRSMFGNRRTYNNGALYSFHSGLDYGVCSEVHPLDIYAPAAGTVVFAGAKTVRGNVTILDHGWGVYSGIFHQKEILVNEGDFVQAGDLIGQIGDTGRVTGPHLHWEVWVNGFQVDPGLWLDQEYPH